MGDDDQLPDVQFPRVLAELGGVPETLLWNLHHRALAMRMGYLDDPRAVEVVEKIDYPFERFDSKSAGYAAQWHALRVEAMDDQIRRHVAAAGPGGTVVALGEGLETTFWRIDDGRVRWVTVELPETVRLRSRLLPDGPRRRTVTGSATDPAWLEEVAPDDVILVTAQGLLMYLDLAEVDALVARCAARFPGRALLFDAIPAWMVTGQQRWLPSDDDPSAYRPPAWTWGIDDEVRRRLSSLPRVADLREARPGRGSGLVFGAALPALRMVPWVRDRIPDFSLVTLQFR